MYHSELTLLKYSSNPDSEFAFLRVNENGECRLTLLSVLVQPSSPSFEFISSTPSITSVNVESDGCSWSNGLHRLINTTAVIVCTFSNPDRNLGTTDRSPPSITLWNVINHFATYSVRRPSTDPEHTSSFLSTSEREHEHGVIDDVMFAGVVEIMEEPPRVTALSSNIDATVYNFRASSSSSTKASIVPAQQAISYADAMETVAFDCRFDFEADHVNASRGVVYFPNAAAITSVSSSPHQVRLRSG
ncbi:hypothetical protein BLNAU_14969 [Blattamonas nauphoetae]|uniref:Uncharacterized protein n=1 Tax=Blattamonas nauphoetae TaxID=2049346 RepID=A0ABQ9XC05_9EUKA|nr:hypothetical protein BLNAU_14969 [Blattamonas nauphoetae]